MLVHIKPSTSRKLIFKIISIISFVSLYTKSFHPRVEDVVFLFSTCKKSCSLFICDLNLWWNGKLKHKIINIFGCHIPLQTIMDINTCQTSVALISFIYHNYEVIVLRFSNLIWNCFLFNYILNNIWYNSSIMKNMKSKHIAK